MSLSASLAHCALSEAVADVLLAEARGAAHRRSRGDLIAKQRPLVDEGDVGVPAVARFGDEAAVVGAAAAKVGGAADGPPN